LTKLTLFFLTLLVLGLTPLAANAVQYDTEPEPYASYDEQTRCKRAAQPGTRELAAWIHRQFKGGTPVTKVRSCRTSGTTEHKDGRAIDWMMDVRKKAHRKAVKAFLTRLFAEDRDENPHALARRMGVMYVIWNDRMWASYDRFQVKPYRSSSCKRLARCSATLRHRDHVHISLSKAGGRGLTSWYAAQP